MCSRVWKRPEFTFPKEEMVNKTLSRLDRTPLLVVFFSCALLLRVLSLGRDLYGDESYYYYLSRFPWEYVVHHRDHPPMLYLLYHPFTDNVATFRIINAIVGSFIPCLVYLILKTYNVRRCYMILGASLPIFFNVFVKYSTFVFLDTLCAFFFLLGVYFYRRERWRLTDLFFGLSILTKEAAILGVAVFMGYLVIRRRSVRFIFPTIILSILVVFIILIPLEGWKSVLYGAPRDHFNPVLFCITPACLPLLAILLYRRHYVEFLFSIIYPLAFFIYNMTAEWYSVLPLSFIIVSFMIALNEIHNLHLGKKTYIKYLLLTFFVSNIALSSQTQAFATYSFVNGRPHHLQDATQFIIKNCEGRRATLIDCFWGYSLYPFGTHLKVVHSAYTRYNFTMVHYSRLINETGLAVVGTLGEKRMNNEVRGLLFQLYAKNIVYRNNEYATIDLNRIQSSNSS